MKNIVFLSQKVGGNIIFTDYWKVLVLIILGMGNTVFFCAKKLMERWYLLITKKALFWTFRLWKIRPLLSREVDRKMIFTGYWEVLVLNFSVMGNAVFFFKDDFYLVFLIFPGYSRTWEIWFFAQWLNRFVFLVFLVFPRTVIYNQCSEGILDVFLP